MMLEHGLPLTGLYTYASPRVGNKKFEQEMNKATGYLPRLDLNQVRSL